MAGGVLNLTLPTTAAVGSADFRACVADEVSKWDKAVRVPFLGHMVQELFDVFDKTEPAMKALLLLTTPNKSGLSQWPKKTTPSTCSALA